MKLKTDSFVVPKFIEPMQNPELNNQYKIINVMLFLFYLRIVEDS
jgi:hypothetical protein